MLNLHEGTDIEDTHIHHNADGTHLNCSKNQKYDQIVSEFEYYRLSSASYKNDSNGSGADVSKEPVFFVFKFSRHLNLGNLKIK